ncbi:MAG: hypothetical protein WDZ46_02195 [Solirubrobacterales bacterium]
MHHDHAVWERAKQSFRREMWRAVVPDAVTGEGIEAQRFGPVLATAFGSEPREPELSLIQGAAEPGAIADGHVADAVEWMRSREVEYRVPVAEGRPGSAAAEEWLEGHEYERGEAEVAFVRDAVSPDGPEDREVEVFELGEHEIDGEGFSILAREGLGLPIMAEALYFGLPGRDGWRCYTAAPAPDVQVIATGAMLVEDGVAVLGLDATVDAERGRGCARALLRRRLRDAAAAGCRTVVAEVSAGEEHAEARSDLLEAGFAEAYAARNWMRPAMRPAVSA